MKKKVDWSRVTRNDILNMIQDGSIVDLSPDERSTAVALLRSYDRQDEDWDSSSCSSDYDYDWNNSGC